MLKLYATPLSANARKPLALAYHLELEFELCEVNVYAGEGQRPEYLALNPAGKIPTLVDGDFVLTESNAILQYLAERHGTGPLFPAEPSARAAIAQWMFWEAAHWQPALTVVLAQHVGHALLPAVVPAPTTEADWSHPELQKALVHLDLALSRGRYLLGDALSVADFSVAAMGTYFRACAFPFDAHPRLRDWYQRIEALPAWGRSAAPLWTPA